MQQDKDFVFSDAEKEFDLVFSALKTGRSLAASYSLQTDIQCKSHVCFAVIEIDCRSQFSYMFNLIPKKRCSNHKVLL